MSIRAVSRSVREKETVTVDLMHKTMEGTLVITNGVVERISLSIEAIEPFGNKTKRVSILNLDLNKAKSLYLVLRSMFSVLGDLEELDECIL